MIALFFDDSMTTLDTTQSKFFNLDQDDDFFMLDFEVLSNRYVISFISDHDNRTFLARFDILDTSVTKVYRFWKDDFRLWSVLMLDETSTVAPQSPDGNPFPKAYMLGQIQSGDNASIREWSNDTCQDMTVEDATGDFSFTESTLCTATTSFGSDSGGGWIYYSTGKTPRFLDYVTHDLVWDDEHDQYDNQCDVVQAITTSSGSMTDPTIYIDNKTDLICDFTPNRITSGCTYNPEIWVYRYDWTQFGSAHYDDIFTIDSKNSQIYYRLTADNSISTGTYD